MYGDTTVIRALARSVADQGADLRREADTIVGLADRVHWVGYGGDGLRTRVQGRALGLRETAQQHDQAAEALRAHAARVDALKAEIEQIMRRVHRLIEAASARVAEVAAKVAAAVVAVADPIDEAIADFATPPPHHRDWLAVPDLMPRW